jgi:hypothetical protein
MAQQDRDENGVYTGPGETMIPLRTPVKRDGKDDLTSLSLREPDAGQLSAYLAKINSTSDEGIEASIELIAAVSGVLSIDIRKLKSRDLDACAEWLALFTKAQPKPTPTV